MTQIGCLRPLSFIGLPPSMVGYNMQYEEAVTFLGSIKTPSGIPPDQNAYLLNLKSVSIGGYLDGMALGVPHHKQRLDENPSAVGHLINHSANNDNVTVVAIEWDRFVNGSDGLEPVICSIGEGSNVWYPLPNVNRFDGALRYLEGTELVHYPNHESFHGVYGAALCAKHDIDADDELLLDYMLVQPLPKWAINFYT